MFPFYSTQPLTSALTTKQIRPTGKTTQSSYRKHSTIQSQQSPKVTGSVWSCDTVTSLCGSISASCRSSRQFSHTWGQGMSLNSQTVARPDGFWHQCSNLGRTNWCAQTRRSLGPSPTFARFHNWISSPGSNFHQSRRSLPPTRGSPCQNPRLPLVCRHRVHQLSGQPERSRRCRWTCRSGWHTWAFPSGPACRSSEASWAGRNRCSSPGGSGPEGCTCPAPEMWKHSPSVDPEFMQLEKLKMWKHSPSTDPEFMQLEKLNMWKHSPSTDPEFMQLEKLNMWKVSKLVFYAPSTSAVISGWSRCEKRLKAVSYRAITKLTSTEMWKQSPSIDSELIQPEKPCTWISK